MAQAFRKITIVRVIQVEGKRLRFESGGIKGRFGREAQRTALICLYQTRREDGLADTVGPAAKTKVQPVACRDRERSLTMDDDRLEILSWGEVAS